MTVIRVVIKLIKAIISGVAIITLKLLLSEKAMDSEDSRPIDFARRENP